jgi:sulfide dehydrogenase cytochrome subunit
MGNKKTMMSVLAGAMALAGASQVNAEPSAEMMANTCAGCHGTAGQSVGPASPNLAGISEAYFTDAMLAFQGDERNATIMNRIAKGYTEGQIEAMAGYFAGLPVYKAPQNVDAALAKKGEEIYEDGCSKCHDEGGGLPDDDAGILAGQWLPYLEYSMADYRAGHRDMPKKMKKAVEKLSDDEVKAVTAFFASQR